MNQEKLKRLEYRAFVAWERAVIAHNYKLAERIYYGWFAWERRQPMPVSYTTHSHYANGG